MSNPSFRLDGKVAVITGASKGLGRAMALGFAEAGADVVISSRKIEACEAVADEVAGPGRRSSRRRLSRRPLGRCDRYVETVAEFGRIDVLVNNAGIAPVPPSLLGVTEDLFDKTIEVNLKGPLRLTGARRRTHAAGQHDHQHQLQSLDPSRHRSLSSMPRRKPG